MQHHFRVTVNGQPYQVTVEEDIPATHQPAPHAAAAPAATPSPAAPPAAAAPAAAAGDELAPMSGMLVEFTVKPGDSVQAGQRIATLEAMKMKSPVMARSAGQVQALHVAPGSAVEAGQPLLRLG